MMDFRNLLYVIGVMLLSACASGPKYSEIQQNLSAISGGKSRVVFYRDGILGAAIQPIIFLNQKEVGNCQPGGVFFVDVAPGKYTASVSTEVERRLSLVVAAGEEKFVRCSITFGLFVGRGKLELMDPTQAKLDIQELSYTGP